MGLPLFVCGGWGVAPALFFTGLPTGWAGDCLGVGLLWGALVHFWGWDSGRLRTPGWCWAAPLRQELSGRLAPGWAGAGIFGVGSLLFGVVGKLWCFCQAYSLWRM